MAASHCALYSAPGKFLLALYLLPYCNVHILWFQKYASMHPFPVRQKKKCQSNPKDKKSKLNRWQATFLVEGPWSNENVKQKRVLCRLYSTHFAGPANISSIWTNSSSSFNIWKETYNQCTTCSEKETWN